MRIFAVLLIFAGILTCLASLGIDTTHHAPTDSPLGTLAVVSFDGQHKQLFVLLFGGIMLIAGSVMFYGEEVCRAIARNASSRS